MIPSGAATSDAGGWQPDSVGLPRAVALATGLVTVLVSGVVYLAGMATVPPPPPLAVTVHLVDAASVISQPATAAAMPTPVPAAQPPAPSEAVPPPELVPDLSPEPASAPIPPVETPLQVPVDVPVALPSPIAVSRPPPAAIAAPARPVPPRARPVRRAIRAPAAASETNADVAAPASPEQAPPSAPAALPRSTAPASPPADTKSGLGPYGAGLHRQIERNMLADRRVTELGVSGTAVIEATIAPDGRVVAARLARSSGTRGIDEAALGAVQRGGFPPFGPHMPAGPITVNVPIGVEAE